MLDRPVLTPMIDVFAPFTPTSRLGVVQWRKHQGIVGEVVATWRALRATDIRRYRSSCAGSNGRGYASSFRVADDPARASPDAPEGLTEDGVHRSAGPPGLKSGRR